MSPHEPDFDSVLEAVREIVPTLRENGLEAEDRRWIPDESIELLEKAGVFRIAVPRRFGGLDLSLPQQYAVLSEIARGCASTGWVAVAWVSTAWLATLYPDVTQEEIFAAGQVRISGAFTAGDSTLVATEGGYLLNGTWRFNTGCRGAEWDLVAATVELPDGTFDEAYALVPMSELSIADDWHVSATIGTGSSTTTARDVFVPAHRLVTVGEALTGTAAGRSNSGATGRDYGLLSMVISESVAIYLGAAKGAYETFVGGLGRPIAYTTWEDQREHPLTQHQVAVAENRIAAAEALFEKQLTLLQERADVGEPLTDTEKATVRGRAGHAIQLVNEAVEALNSVSSASSLVRKGHFRRFRRDIEALTLHGLMNPNMSLEVHGRVLVGLDPGTPYI
ncbi:acyl-CoA dehydrogenase family protein [Streptomyces sp. NPDC002787]